ncbi:hypothetical protein GCM10010970_36090 [Silvimonas iriomotensis]|uniref:Uncharacterized protein n=1 Tax=Silvimonas iriomotensis TaxID=449662 RepID=A0ABQ2PEJ5_9NEIS|nr:hypothetical protein GCM10010970_36090 [Silvimonas iriomotensis]
MPLKCDPTLAGQYGLGAELFQLIGQQTLQTTRARRVIVQGSLPVERLGAGNGAGLARCAAAGCRVTEAATRLLGVAPVEITRTLVAFKPATFSTVFTARTVATIKTTVLATRRAITERFTTFEAATTGTLFATRTI